MGFLGSSFEAVAPSSDQLNTANGAVMNGMQTSAGLGARAAGQNGFANQNNVFAQQQALASQLQQQALGGGPNPAQAALANNTGANVQQQAALMGSQRGTAANAGLLARQAAYQGANIQQQAVGQAAALQANQTLAAQQNLMAQQQALGQTAANQVGNQYNANQLYNQAALGNQQNQFGLQQNANSANAGVQNANTGIASSAIGGLLGGAGAAAAAMAHGGSVPEQGRMVGSADLCSYFLEGGTVPGRAQVAGDSRKNDTVHAMLSPGEIVVPRSHASDPNKAAAFARAVAMKNRKGLK